MRSQTLRPAHYRMIFESRFPASLPAGALVWLRSLRPLRLCAEERGAGCTRRSRHARYADGGRTASAGTRPAGSPAAATSPARTLPTFTKHKIFLFVNGGLSSRITKTRAHLPLVHYAPASPVAQSCGDRSARVVILCDYGFEHCAGAQCEISEQRRSLLAICSDSRSSRFAVAVLSFSSQIRKKRGAAAFSPRLGAALRSNSTAQAAQPPQGHPLSFAFKWLRLRSRVGTPPYMMNLPITILLKPFNGAKNAPMDAPLFNKHFVMESFGFRAARPL